MGIDTINEKASSANSRSSITNEMELHRPRYRPFPKFHPRSSHLGIGEKTTVMQIPNPSQGRKKRFDDVTDKFFGVTDNVVAKVNPNFLTDRFINYFVGGESRQIRGQTSAARCKKPKYVEC